jgi:rubrerythrin
MASTVENLQEAFAGESKANRLYLAFAQKAEEEGFPQVAKLFRAVAEAETIHALMHLSVLKGVRSTADNLRHSIDEERYEHTSMYPGFIEQAKKDGDINALRSFTLANNVEKVHEKLYLSAAHSISVNMDIPAKRLYLCPVCGNIEEEAPDRCPVCGASGSSFKEVL